MPAHYTTHDELVVLTGDIVASGRMSPAELDAAMAELAGAAEEVMRVWGHGLAGFTRFRGDGWQCLAPPPARVLRCVLLLTARLRTLGRARATRIAIGIGPGTLPEGAGLATASGPAFELSGRCLDGMPGTDRVALAWTDPPQDAGLLQAIFTLAAALARGWTPRQAEAIARSLAPEERPSQKAIAAELGIRQQSAARLLVDSGQPALLAALAVLEA